MPSWNIHIAHVERLLREKGARSLGIRDENAFLFGNVLPDVYVGYMVKHPSIRIDYKLTHLTMRDHIPIPRYQDFWDFYVVNPHGYGADCVTDLVKGAWCHLVCDNVYNTHTRAFLRKVHLRAGETARIKKQGDFALFGRTLDISSVPEPDHELISQCRAFPMYRVVEPDISAACSVCENIVCENCASHIEGSPDYELLTPGFFETAQAEAHARMIEGLQDIRR